MTFRPPKETRVPSVRTRDIMTYYEVHGEGKALILIPGAGVSHHMWKPEVEHFSGKYTVIIDDVRGHGQSEGADRGYSCELFADDLHTPRPSFVMHASKREIPEQFNRELAKFLSAQTM
jgi:alpha-beta hydrolase superfamily lysophospholipase